MDGGVVLGEQRSCSFGSQTSMHHYFGPVNTDSVVLGRADTSPNLFLQNDSSGPVRYILQDRLRHGCALCRITEFIFNMRDTVVASRLLG